MDVERSGSKPSGAPSVTLPSHPARHPGVETAYLYSDAVLYDQRSDIVIRLNASAAAVWMLIDGARDVGDVVAETARVFEMDEGSLRPDIEAALEAFVRQDLLVEGT